MQKLKRADLNQKYLFSLCMCVGEGGGGGGVWAQSCAKTLSTGAVKKCTHKINKVNPQKRDKLCISMSMLPPGCKESQFYSLPFGWQAVASMY